MNPTAEPVADRPYMPDYGIPTSTEGILPWSHVTERMTAAKYYWITTVSPEGHPHATPVDGLWVNDQLCFGGSPKTRRNRNLASNPAVCVHLESGIDVVILHGEAHALRVTDRDLAAQLAQGTIEKYGYSMKPEDYLETEGVYAFRPRLVLAWSDFPKDATRWRFG
jgi:hypothetical protein